LSRPSRPSCSTSSARLARRSSSGSLRRCGEECSGLLLELALVVPDERPDLIRHVEELEPLLLVEGHRKPAEPVHRKTALLADLDGDGPGSPGLEGLVFGPQPFQLRPQFLVGCHRFAPGAQPSNAHTYPARRIAPEDFRGYEMGLCRWTSRSIF